MVMYPIMKIINSFQFQKCFFDPSLCQLVHLIVLSLSVDLIQDVMFTLQTRNNIIFVQVCLDISVSLPVCSVKIVQKNKSATVLVSKT